MNPLLLGLLLTRQYRRNWLLLALLFIVPTVFITMSYYTTRAEYLDVLVTAEGDRVVQSVWMPDLHGAMMVPIAAAFLSGMCGLFIMLDSARADSRLAIAGVSTTAIGAARLAMILAFSTAVALLSVMTTLVQERPGDVAAFVGANILVAITYGFIGAFAAMVVGRLGGAYLMLFAPMIDVGIFQDPMLVSGQPPLWMQLFPGFGGTRLGIDAAFTVSGDDWPALAAATTWATLLCLVAFVTFVRRPGRT